MIARITALLMLLAGAAQAQDTLYFSAIPDEDETRLAERFDAVAEYLTGELGVPVQFVPVKSYPAAVTAFRNDQVQLAWFGGLSGVQARLLVEDARAIAQGAEDAEFVTYFIANTETGLTESEEFPEAAKGMSFTFGAKTSTSGRLMPDYHIREATGQAPEEFFGRVGFSGDHSQTLRLVASGAWDVGALNFAVYDQAVADNAPEIETAKIIWKTPPYPDYNWTIRGDVDARWGEGFADRVQAALIGMEDEDLLAAFPRTGFIPATNDDYAPIEDVARQLELLD
ncbi:putative selenate ABC transporter substrate-binding protein [Paracoccus sp. 1_MG-2023]|uniref:putative selenate ABC transporter substrate-binding protein n=1 Tax=unclassified Paracoccus (in: a-proteobacteria) TaxID=2688777 RepID=UPI001C080F3E|nr:MULTISPECIES: putative selenate ABC transporter substrate-binding protein [unclassified Paracoccus (in: a-proteobacteria)]MBU2957757.1 putative selenate ABC transporter substrate-binding protein [Paracoccus sp. C2R09]MDO6667395.1 putative selenate ABC transporter substrate-binding protein [Paracoccus sp. 1_MG-2023]